jgi:DNA-binding transcriptional ArsR family regulator
MRKTRLPQACTDALADHLRPELFRALCDPNRLALLAGLAVAPEPLTVSEAAKCCDVHLSVVSRHLALLREAGIVEAEKVGREVSYRLNFRELVATLRGLADAIEQCCTTSGCCGAAPAQEEA